MKKVFLLQSVASISDDEKKLLHVFIGINQLVENIYQLQIADSENAVYPPSLLAKKSIWPKLFANIQQHNSYTTFNLKHDSVVEVPYYDAYRSDYDHILYLLRTTNNLNISNGLKKFITDVQTLVKKNDWIGLDISFLESSSDSSLIWNFGPIESASDKYLGVKKYLSSLVAIRSPQYQYIETFTKFTLSFHNAMNCLRYALNPGKVVLVIAEVYAWAGEIGETEVCGWSRPEDVHVIEQHGTIKQLFVNTITDKINNHYLSLVDKMYPQVIATTIKHFMKTHHIEIIAMHELCHTIGKFSGYRERLGTFYNLFEEIRADILSYLFAVHLESAGVLERGFLENMMLTNLVVDAHMRQIFLTQGTRKAYYYLFLQYWQLIKPRVKLHEGKLTINLQEIEAELLALVNMLHALAHRGSASDIENYLAMLELEEADVPTIFS